MPINANNSSINLVYANGTRMERAFVDGVKVYEALNGNVTLVYAGGSSGSFSPGDEDVNRHFVVVASEFSGSGLPYPGVPSINGTVMTEITAGTSGNFGDGGTCGIYTIKLPSGTSNFTISAGRYTSVTIFRVTGCTQMTSAVSAGTTATSFGGSYASPANGMGCFFGGTVGNFYNATSVTPVSSGLAAGYGNSQGYHAASNTVTANSQYVSTNGNQISSFAIFAYDLF